MITHNKFAHSLLSRVTGTILGLLSEVLGAYERVFYVHFAKISFYFFTKLNSDLMNEDRFDKSLVLSNDFLE